MATDPLSVEDALRLLGPSRGDRTPVELGDLGRISMERMVAQHAGTARVIASRGWLRLAGAGVKGHAVPMGAVGRLMTGWQDLVHSLGAAREGVRSVRGRLPGALIAQTLMMLDATPGPGSVVLTIRADEESLQAAFPDGESLFGYGQEQRPMADAAMADALDLIAEVSRDAVVRDELAERLVELGPRVASRLKDVLKEISDDGLDLDAGWVEPGRPTIRVKMSSGQAKAGMDAIASRNLDAEDETIVGVLATSSIRQSLAIETDDGDVLVVKRGEVPDMVMAQLPPMTRVEVVATVKSEITAGGALRTTRTAKEIRKIEG